jgi:hypothetical protein
MTSDVIKKMRGKQFIVTNGLLLTFITIYFIMISFLNVTTARLFLILGVILLIQAIFGFLKVDSTKSFFSILEQVANYEKQKMGVEWKKQRKMGYLWILITSGFMFIQAYLNRDSTEKILQLDLRFILIMVLFIVALSNISLILHVRKVDRSISELDMKGYAWKSNIFSIVLGVFFGMVIIVFTIFYVLL